MTGIVTILFNQPAFLLHQHAHLQAFCTEPYDLLVIDNSTDVEAINAIKYYSARLGLRYIKTNAATTDGSQSHSFAAQFAYQRFKDKYDVLFFIDHDAFAIKSFSPSAILANHLMAGLPQVRGDKKYFWPGCLIFKTSVDIDFSMTAGLDTGGNTYKAIQEHGEDQCLFFDETYQQNPGFNKSKYDFYALINGGTFLHFINGSNWAGSAENEDRLNSLFNVLSEYLQQKQL